MSTQIPNQWPRIGRFLRVNKSTGWIEDDHLTFTWVENRLNPAERAAAYEEWADFYEWRQERLSSELGADRVRRHLTEEWTDSMVYTCRRSAAFARGEDPGPWVPQATRRPDLSAEQRALVAEVVTPR